MPGRYKKRVGIYTIFCNANKKYYVGSAKVIQKRWDKHRNLLNTGKHFNDHLQNAFNKYGKASFIYTVIEDLPLDSEMEYIFKKEREWVLFFKSHLREHGFNKFLPGAGDYPKREKENRNTVRNKNGNPGRPKKPVVCINRLNGELEEFESLALFASTKDIAPKRAEQLTAYWRTGKGRKYSKEYIAVYRENYNKEFDYILHTQRKKNSA